MRCRVKDNPDFNWFSLQQWVFDTNLQRIANVILAAAVKQSAKVRGPLVLINMIYFNPGCINNPHDEVLPWKRYISIGSDCTYRNTCWENLFHLTLFITLKYTLNCCSVGQLFPFLELQFQRRIRVDLCRIRCVTCVGKQSINKPFEVCLNIFY